MLLLVLACMQVLSTIVRVLLQDLDMKKAIGPHLAPFDQRPYFRLLLSLLQDLNTPDRILDSSNLQVLTCCLHDNLLACGLITVYCMCARVDNSSCVLRGCMLVSAWGQTLVQLSSRFRKAPHGRVHVPN